MAIDAHNIEVVQTTDAHPRGHWPAFTWLAHCNTCGTEGRFGFKEHAVRWANEHLNSPHVAGGTLKVEEPEAAQVKEVEPPVEEADYEQT